MDWISYTCLITGSSGARRLWVAEAAGWVCVRVPVCTQPDWGAGGAHHTSSQEARVGAHHTHPREAWVLAHHTHPRGARVGAHHTSTGGSGRGTSHTSTGGIYKFLTAVEEMHALLFQWYAASDCWAQVPGQGEMAGHVWRRPPPCLGMSGSWYFDYTKLSQY